MGLPSVLLLVVAAWTSPVAAEQADPVQPEPAAAPAPGVTAAARVPAKAEATRDREPKLLLPRVSAAIAVPASARAGEENRMKEDAARAAREAEESAARARASAGRVLFESSTVMRAGDKRFGITVFRHLMPFRWYSRRPAECARPAAPATGASAAPATR